MSRATTRQTNLFEISRLVRDVRGQMTEILGSRYVFRTHQEILRRNDWLAQRPRHLFGNWARLNYVTFASIGIRRLSGDFEDEDVNLKRLIQTLSTVPQAVWNAIAIEFQQEASEKLSESKAGKSQQQEAARRFLDTRRKMVERACQKVVHFASKKVAHFNPRIPVTTTFNDLDEAIDTLATVTEECTTIQWGIWKAESPSAASRREFPVEALMRRTLEAEMVAGLPVDWETIFLRPWADEATLKLGLGWMKPPTSK